MENRPHRVRRIFLDGPVYLGGVFSALFVLSHTNGARRTTGTGTGTGTGTTRRKRAEIPTTHILCYCVLLRTHSAPKTRIARASELVCKKWACAPKRWAKNHLANERAIFPEILRFLPPHLVWWWVVPISILSPPPRGW